MNEESRGSEPVRTELTVPSSIDVLHMIRSYVRELCALADLPADRTEALVLAVDEAATNVIEHAFEPGEAGTLTVAGELTAATLRVGILDKGMPFDASMAPPYAPPTGGDATKASIRGLGLHLIREAVDEVHWINHGRDGKELRLAQHLPNTYLPTSLPHGQLGAPDEKHVSVPAGDYTVRRFQPDDALGVARTIYRTYGGTYPIDDLYSPERIVALNERGELVSAVAVTDSGDVVGHTALKRPDLGRIAEVGVGVVDPAHRKHGLLERMVTFLEHEGLELGLAGIYGQAVTTHTYSQRALEVFGFHACGIALGTWPSGFRFKRILTDPRQQRESLALYFKYLPTLPRASVHVPPHHKGILERLYDRLDVPVEFCTGPVGTPAVRSRDLDPEGVGRAGVSFLPAFGHGMITIHEAGSGSLTEIRRARSDLSEIAGAEAVYLDLPLTDPGTPALCELAEREGFSFAGLWPLFAPDGDILRLQHLTNPLNTDLVRVTDTEGMELLEYINQERERIGRLMVTP